MKKIIKLSESDLLKIVRRVIKEQEQLNESITLNNPNIVRTLKNNKLGGNGTFSAKGTKVNFAGSGKTMAINVPNFANMTKGTWRINGTNIIFQ